MAARYPLFFKDFSLCLCRDNVYLCIPSSCFCFADTGDDHNDYFLCYTTS